MVASLVDSYPDVTSDIMIAVRVLLVIAIAGCGRLAFDPVETDGTCDLAIQTGVIAAFDPQ